MSETKNYPVTDRVERVVNGVKLVHEISDTKESFRHRLCAGGSLGDWVSWEWFACADLDGRQFRACQDNWQPMFPPIFEIVS